MKESKKRLLSLLGTIGICTIVLVGTAYAWYNENKKSSVSNIEVHVSHAHNLQASFDAVNYSNDLSAVFNESKFKQVSGDGATFYKAVTSFGAEDAETGVRPQYLSGFSRLGAADYASNLYYQDIYFRVDKNIKFQLDSTSNIRPGNVSQRINDDGFSKDYIAAAVRFGIAVIDDDTNQVTSKFIWAPNSTYEYTTGASGNTINANGNVEGLYTYAIGTQVTSLKTVPTNAQANGAYQIAGGPKFIWGNLNSDVDIINVDEGTTHLAFSIWIEGTDRECVESMFGGQVSVNIKFDSEEIIEE